MLTRRISTDGIAFYVSPLLERAGVRHAFSTRIGGISPAPFDSLNLGNPSDGTIRDEYERIYENYRRLQRAIGFHEDCRRCWMHQVHGGAVAHVQCDEEFRDAMQADAIVGDDPQRILAVRVADCAPVLLATADGRTVAAVHAGWRGVVCGVVPSAVRALSERGSAAPEGLLAAIGPCIGFESFEVAPEVLNEFQRLFGTAAPTRRRSDGKGNVDLRAAVRTQLLCAGIAPDRIDTTDRCTYRDRDDFFSHRRERGITGRMAALIAPAA